MALETIRRCRSKPSLRRGLATAVRGVLATSLLVVIACPPRTSTPPSLELPAAYIARAAGDVMIDDLVFSGRAMMDYLILPTDEVRITRLRFWINDSDIVVRGPLGVERRRERLRCTTFGTARPVHGRLTPPNRLTVASGMASVSGFSWAERAPDGTCPGMTREITATNNADFSFFHDPAGDVFTVTASFTGMHDGDSISIRIEMIGSFVNRPPVPVVGVGGPGLPVESIQGACPPVVAGNPPYTPANDPEGFRVRLLSMAADPDGGWNRSDITREYWLLSTDGGPLTLLGDEQLIGPVLFPTGTRNRLVLEASDRQGARARKICEFQVLERPGGGG